MGFRISSEDSISRIEGSNFDTNLIDPANILITAGVGGGKCQKFDTLVTMSDGTTKELYKIEKGEKIITYNIKTGQAEISIVKESLNMGIKKGYKITILGGDTLICSEDHKFLKGKVKRPIGKKNGTELYIDEWNWIPLKELKRMDLIATPQKYPRITYDIYDPKIYELIGYLIGNGGLTQDCVIVSCPNQEVANYLLTLLPSNMEIKKHSEYNNKKNYDYTIKCKETLFVEDKKNNVTNINPLKRILADLGMMGTLSKHKSIPKEILQASDSNLYRLLSGLLASDGWIDKKGIGYSTSSDQLKDDFSTLLRNLSIDYYVSRKNAKFQGKIFPAWQFGINKRENLQKISDNCNLIHKQEKLRKHILTINEKEKGQRGINKIYRTKDLKFQRIKKIEPVGDTQMWDLEVENQSHNYVANNIIVHNTMALEQVANFFHRNGYTVISLSDVKDGLEQGFCMFPPRAEYHKRKLRKFGCPQGAIPTKIYHPFSFNLPRNDRLPDINIYTLNIKTLSRIDLGFLAESSENKRSIQIILDTLSKLQRHEGIHHLIFKAEEQTESQANLTKGAVKYRSDNPDDFFTRSKIGTEKTSGEMSAYFKPFLQDYTLTPANCPYNLNIKELINDQKNYHIFTTKWIQDRRLKAFYILHILQQIIQNETNAKYPICLVIEEIRFLTPNSNDGFTSFLAEELKNTMTRMRNMGKGFAIVSSTQVYRDVHTAVLDSFNENIFGRIPSLKELEFIGKSLKLNTADVNLIKSLEVGEFILKTKDEYSDEATLQKVKFYLPPHAHKEGRYSFFEFYAQEHPDQLRTYNKEINDIQKIKEDIIQEVIILKEKENTMKKEVAEKEKEAKAENYTKYVEKLRSKIKEEKENKTKEKAEALNDKIKELIYEEWLGATGKDKSTRNIAKKFNLYLGNGDPNAMAVQRAIKQKQKEKQNTETQGEENDEEDTQDTYNEKGEREDP